MIFDYDNPFREFLRSVVSTVYFANFIYTLIALNSLLLMLDEPRLDDNYQIQTIGIFKLSIARKFR